MSAASIKQGALRADLDWSESGGLSCLGDPELCQKIRALSEESHAGYSPLLGGSYVGWEMKKPAHFCLFVQHLDGLDGFDVTMRDLPWPNGEIPEFPVQDMRSPLDIVEKFPQDIADGLLGEGRSVGIFTRVPLLLAEQLPDLFPHDLSPPHVTVLYCGDIPLARSLHFCALVREVLEGTDPFRVGFGDLGHFNTGKRELTPWFAWVHIERALRELRDRLRDVLLDAGFPVLDAGRDHWRPHTTLAYLPDGEKYTDPVPVGGWRIMQYEVWGLPWVERIPTAPVLQKSLGDVFREEFGGEELVKSVKGEQKADHKYIRREPLPGGGWHYFYKEGDQEKSHRYDDDHEIHARHKHLDEGGGAKPDKENVKTSEGSQLSGAEPGQGAEDGKDGKEGQKPEKDPETGGNENDGEDKEEPGSAQYKEAVNNALGKFPDGMRIITQDRSTYTKEGDRWRCEKHDGKTEMVPGNEMAGHVAETSAVVEGLSKSDYPKVFKRALWAFIQGAVPGSDPTWEVRFDKKHWGDDVPYRGTRTRDLSEHLDDKTKALGKEEDKDDADKKPEDKPKPVKASKEDLKKKREELAKAAEDRLLQQQLKAASDAIKRAREQKPEETPPAEPPKPVKASKPEDQEPAKEPPKEPAKPSTGEPEPTRPGRKKPTSAEKNRKKRQRKQAGKSRKKNRGK